LENRRTQTVSRRTEQKTVFFGYQRSASPPETLTAEG
jgi:hypothetical protein